MNLFLEGRREVRTRKKFRHVFCRVEQSREAQGFGQIPITLDNVQQARLAALGVGEDVYKRQVLPTPG